MMVAISMVLSFHGWAAELTWTGGVAGVWQNGAAGWTSGGSPVTWNNATPDDALFGGLNPGSVSIAAGGVMVGNLTVTQGVYSIEGSGVLTLFSSIITIGSSLTTTVNVAMDGSAAFIKSGNGLLVLGDTNKNFTGQAVLNAGAVRIGATGAGSLGSTATNGVSFSGGALHALFPANVNVSNFMAIGAAGGELRNLGNDSQRWQLVANRITGSGPLTLSFGTSNTRFALASSQTGFTGRWIVDSGGNANRFVDVVNGSGFGGATGDVAMVLQNNGALLLRNGVVLGSATQGVYIGSGEAKVTAAGGAVVTMAGKISGPATNTIQFYGDNASSVIILSNTANSWAGATAINGAAAFTTLRLGASEVLPSTGGVVTISGTGRLDLNGFSETMGGLTGAGRVDNAAAASSSFLLVGGNPSNTTFTGSMTNSGAGATLSLVKIGSGTLTLNTTNLYYSGSTIISGGVVQISTATNGSLGATMTNLVRVNGGALHALFPSNTLFLNHLEIGPNGAEFRNLGLDNQRWLMYTPVNGLSGSGTVTLSFGPDVTRFILTNNQPVFTGKWIIDSGGVSAKLIDTYHGGAFGAGTGDDVITLRNSGALILRPNVILGSTSAGLTLGSGTTYIETAGGATSIIAGKISGPATNALLLFMQDANSLLLLTNTANSWLGATTLANTGTLRIAASGVVPDAGGIWTLQSAVTIDLNGQREVFGALSGSGNVDNRATGTAAMIGIGANSSSTTFSGAFSNSAAGATLGVTKVGSGTLTLSSAAHSHGGSTIVSSGVLLVTGTLPTNGQAEVAAGTLACGTTIGNLRLRGGRISPANTSAGSLTVASINFTGGTYRVDINHAVGTPGAQWDLITVAGGAGVVTNDTVSSSPVKIELVYGSASLPGFDGETAFRWRIVDAASQVGFATNKFTVETALFIPPQKAFGYFSVNEDGGDLYLDFNLHTNPVDLAVTIVSSTNFALSGNTVTYTIVVTNNSSSVAGSYTITNTLTENLHYQGATAGGVTNGVNLTWTLGSLAPGAFTTLVVNATPLYTGSTQAMSNVVSVVVTPRYGDTAPGNNTGNVSVNTVGIPLLSDLAMLVLLILVAYAGWRWHQRTAASRA
jgi:uncharacterized repeat protein (TIGR01451 family)